MSIVLNVVTVGSFMSLTPSLTLFGFQKQDIFTAPMNQAECEAALVHSCLISYLNGADFLFPTISIQYNVVHFKIKAEIN